MNPLLQTKVLFSFPFPLFLPFFMNAQVKQESVCGNACVVMGGMGGPVWREQALFLLLAAQRPQNHCNRTAIAPHVSPVTVLYGSLGIFHLRASSPSHLFSLTFSSEPTNTPYPKRGEKEFPIYTYHSSNKTLGMADDFRI